MIGPTVCDGRAFGGEYFVQRIHSVVAVTFIWSKATERNTSTDPGRHCACTELRHCLYCRADAIRNPHVVVPMLWTKSFMYNIREGFCGQGLRCKASHKDRVLPPLDGPGGVALSRRTDTDSRASQPGGVLRTAAGGRDPATARDRESNSATCNSPPLLVRPAQAQCHTYPVAVVWLKGDSVPPQAERG